jgi:hypothetical protein
MQLSKNFNLQEMTKSESASRFNLDNTPAKEAIENLKILCEKVLQPVRDHYGKSVRINSGYRSPEVNSKVGGSKTSDHCLGKAADIEIDGVTNYDLAKWIMDNLTFRQVILEFYTPGIPDSGWVHVSFDANDNKKESLTAISKNGKIVYESGLIK